MYKSNLNFYNYEANISYDSIKSYKLNKRMVMINGVLWIYETSFSQTNAKRFQVYATFVGPKIYETVLEDRKLPRKCVPLER